MQEGLFGGKDIAEMIKGRISVRTYRAQPLAGELKDKLEQAFTAISGPFGVPVRFKLMESNMALKESQAKLGTYGVIKGASSYIGAAAAPGEKNLEEIGYTLEKVILYAASLGLGTCWLGGTFRKSDFARAMGLKEDEILPCITPVGYPSERKSVVETIMRFSAGSKNRKGWGELFYENDFQTGLDSSRAGEYALPLEMVRLAPSASNKQPWRIVREGDRYHFYLQHTRGYAKVLAYDLQRVDMGIAMCHFDLAREEAGIKGSWEICDPRLPNLPPDTEYTVSWTGS